MNHEEEKELLTILEGILVEFQKFNKLLVNQGIAVYKVP